jgi:hypothetical protein
MYIFACKLANALMSQIGYNIPHCAGVYVSEATGKIVISVFYRLSAPFTFARKEF